MSKTKRCPACQRELPILAVRCKYCGFKLSGQAAPDDEPAARPSAPPPAPPSGRPSAPPPPPPKRASTPPPAPDKGGPKRTMMMQNFAPPQPQQSAEVGAAFTEAEQNRTQELGTAKPADGPVGIGQTASPSMSGERTTLPPPPVTRPPSAPPLELEEVDEETRELEEKTREIGSEDIEEEGLHLETGDLEDWIPGADELGDDTGLIDLDADDVEELMPGTAVADDVEEIDASDAVEEIEDYEGADDGEEIEPSNFFLKYVLPDETLDGFEEKGWPGGLVKAMGKLRWWHAIAAAGVTLSLVVMIIVLAVSGDEPEVPEIPDELPALADAPPSVPSAPSGKPAGEQPAAQPAADVAPPAAEPDQPIPAAGKSCRALGEYPDFPWKKMLGSALDKAGAKSVCGLFGAAPAKLSGAFAGKPQVGPGGYDLVQGGGLLEVFPVGKPNRRGASMEYLFVGDKLYEVRFKYWDRVKRLDTKAFGEAFESPGDKPDDHLGRKLTTYLDGDVVIEIFEEKWYGRKLLTLVFASKSVREALAADEEQRDRAEELIADGESLFGSRKYEDAIAKFDEAAEQLPRLGKALVKKALVLTRTEDFEQVESTAKKVLEISREHRVRAEAFGLIALAALFNGDKDKAITQFKAAAAADLANSLFAISHEELETGDYEMARVALTAARMECLTKKKISGTDKGLLARGNFPDFATYFKVMRKAKKKPKFDKRKRDYMKFECR